jgi:NAD(P)-dependent dehydrogenase (short-subunit alcohol dehydrogenase family)
MDHGVLIFGATSSTGIELSKRLHQAGYSLFLCGRSDKKLSSLAKEVDSEYAVIDSWEKSAVDNVVKQAHEKLGTISAVTNLVGSLLLKSAHSTTDDEWQQTLEANLTSCFSILRSVIPVMQKGEGGSIVFVSSAAALNGMANHEAIAAAKAGVVGLSRSAAATYASRGIRVNCVAPGLVRSQMTEKMLSNSMTEEVSRSMHAVGRLGEPSDVASMIQWLLTPENSWVSGQVFSVDGGLSSLMPKMKAKVS